MLLVGEKDVVQKRTLTGKEGTCNFKSFCMPKFADLLTFFLNFWFVVLSSRLQQETHFSAHAEIGNCQDGELVEEGVPAQLYFILVLLEELLHRDWLDLHDIAYIQIVDPLVLVKEAKYTPHVGLLFFKLIILSFFVISRRVFIALRFLLV